MLPFHPLGACWLPQRQAAAAPDVAILALVSMKVNAMDWNDLTAKEVAYALIGALTLYTVLVIFA